MQVRSIQGDTLDRVCQRVYGRTAGVAEQLLSLNPGLADLGPILPTGTLITLPQQAKQAEATLLQLWD